MRALVVRAEYDLVREAKLAVRAVTFAVRAALVSSSCWKVLRSVVAEAARLSR